MHSDFYDDVRYCSVCESYVQYLLALDTAYCVGCGGKVSLYARKDLTKLLGSDSTHKGRRAAKDDAVA
jgi:hypothetical protein